jgi:hypothetical protein
MAEAEPVPSLIPFQPSQPVDRRKLAEDVTRAVSAYLAELLTTHIAEALTTHLHAMLAPVAPAAAPPGERTHSFDYRSVSWDGRTYRLTAMQAAVVRMLWEAWEAGAPDVGQATLMEAADSCGDRLRDVFRRSAAWGELVIAGETKGTCRLAVDGFNVEKC